ncbi:MULTISPECIES: sensor histidine kinase [Brevibacillus]|jgi:two-component system sensor histidine kinase DesK|uniref:histidine kinase n=1 Tax=Brevibacillus borstelensis AK1 TaxID=1300222 RepID=M8DGN6_9BACL|nr:sensor histidine kinase [Brevibacillus borstelensis]EMT52628.1 integral membrane sensor signal transduction histidine kinase [Brevibacillus borstelensis AK1]KKX55092.1 histidine kinase [Brevibacillus borstelensis cifa_chp40]MBE5396947.1 sensor histidine kinase [Brevibacillus borstelensis]MCC0563809.1 sensor histidine kinase [Brevibacillus borstelensis]MCM3472072.1 sensor histidine kinase [Brevibacillus borstelensis]
MIRKLYPREQIKNYLLLDVISVVFLFYYVLRSNSTLGLSGSFILLLAFLVSFYMGLWYRNLYLLAAVLTGFVTLALLGMYVGPNLLFYGFIFADLLGRSKSKWHIGVGIAAIALMFMAVFWKRTGNLLDENSILLPFMIIQMFFPIVIYIKEKAKTLQGELDAANKQLGKFIQQEERQRIARDLHDTLGQTLTMIKLKSELATKWIDKDPSQAKEELKDILATSRIALKQVRELVSDMKFTSLANEIEHSRELLHTAGIEFEVVEKGKPPLLSSVEETMVALSIREAMTNIVKHSRAKRCTLQLETMDNHYWVTITDDGVGLVNQKSGNGIQSMNERMQALHGTFIVTDSPTGGTVVSMKLPLRRQGKEDPAL